MKKKQWLRKKAWELYKEIILKKSNYICEICGGKATTAHHYVRQANSKFLRYDLDNGVAVCTKCHFKIHSRPEVEGIIVLNRGRRWYNKIQKKKGIIIKETEEWLSGQILKLKKELNKYESKKT